jgi:hypothetical protein
MIHPLSEDVTQLKLEDLDAKILDLGKKYYTAARLGKPELLTQIDNLLIIYKEERKLRYAQELKKTNEGNTDLNSLINVE